MDKGEKGCPSPTGGQKVLHLMKQAKSRTMDSITHNKGIRKYVVIGGKF